MIKMPATTVTVTVQQLNYSQHISIVARSCSYLVQTICHGHSID